MITNKDKAWAEYEAGRNAANVAHAIYWNCENGEIDEASDRLKAIFMAGFEAAEILREPTTMEHAKATYEIWFAEQKEPHDHDRWSCAMEDVQKNWLAIAKAARGEAK